MWEGGAEEGLGGGHCGGGSEWPMCVHVGVSPGYHWASVSVVFDEEAKLRASNKCRYKLVYGCVCAFPSF